MTYHGAHFSVNNLRGAAYITCLVVDDGSPCRGCKFYLSFDCECVYLSWFMQERLALAIGYHISLGSILKVPAWVVSFTHATHVQDTDKAILPPLDLLSNTTYPDDPT